MIPGVAVDLSIRSAAASQVAARAKKASLFSGSFAPRPRIGIAWR